MTKPRPLLRVAKYEKACNFRGATPSHSAKPANSARKMWDPLSTHKMQPQAGSRLTTIRAETRPTKLEIPRAPINFVFENPFTETKRAIALNHQARRFRRRRRCRQQGRPVLGHRDRVL